MLNWTRTIDDTTVLNDDYWILADCKTPVLTQIRLVADSPEKPRWDDGTSIKEGIKGERPTYRLDGEGVPILNGKYAIDASNHVLELNENWSASDFFGMEHTGTIKFLLNKGLFSNNTDLLDINYENIFDDDGNRIGRNLDDITEKLENLKDKAFYIEIWAEYQELYNTKYTFADNPQGLEGLTKVFTGICLGGSIETSIGQKIMTCKISDYTTVLKNQFFYNSPFFDGMQSACAMYEILTMAGFREEGKYDPVYILKQLAQNESYLSAEEHKNIDGRKFFHYRYGLPSGYSRLEQPAYKFPDGSTYYDAITKLCNDSGKCFYFDQYGIAHFEDFAEKIIAAANSQYKFDTIWYFTTNPDIHDGQLIFNKLERGHNVEDAYNHIKLVSNTPDMELLVFDDVNYDSWDNPDAEGFLGYTKSWIQHEGMFGSEENVRQRAREMRHFFRPPINLDFETYGVPIRPFDFVEVDGEQVRVMSVDNTFDPKDNKWWMTVKCERYLPSKSSKE